MDDVKRKIYCDGEYLYFVFGRIENHEWHFTAKAPMFVTCGGNVLSVRNKKLPVRSVFSEAQTDLDNWADKHNLQKFEAVA